MVEIPEALLHDIDMMAQRLNVSPSRLLQLALENFLAQYAELPIINQGDVYWLQRIDSDIPHPHVVIQDDVLNHSRIHTVVVCSLTSNIQRVNMPGNILLEADEANLPKRSVVEISKVSTVNKIQLGEYIGSLSKARIEQILAGMRFIQSSFGG